MRGFFARQYTWMTVMIFLSIFLVAFSSIAAASSYILGLQQTRLSENAETVSDFTASSLVDVSRRDPRFRNSLALLGEVMGVHILVCGPAGHVIMCSDFPFCLEHIDTIVPETLAETVSRNGSHVEQGTLGGIYDTTQNVAACMVGSSPLFVTVSSPASENRALIIAFMRILIYVSAAVIVISFISAYVITKRMTNPLKAMAASAQSYARGDFTTRVPVGSDYNDEIGRLCVNFNSMADSLQQLEELRQGFIANVSHELRTPMTVVSGYVDGILDGTIPDESRAEYLKIIRGEILRLSRLVAKMLDVSNMQSGHITYAPQPINAFELMRQVFLGFENRVEDGGFDVEFVLPDEDAAVSFDPDALTQIFTNLIDNAIKFTPRGGKLAIKAAQKGGKVHISIANSGLGIPAGDLPFIFDRFYKTDKSRSGDRLGLGLGLYIVRSILRWHGEDIHVSSENGMTAFTFTLTVMK